MSTKTMLKGAISTGGHLRAWTGVPVGVGVTYAAGRVMPDFAQIENQWLYPLPYCAPAAVLGVFALFSPKTKNAGYGVLGGTAAYYLWAVISNLTSDSGSNKMPDFITTTPGADTTPLPILGAAVQILGGN